MSRYALTHYIEEKNVVRAIDAIVNRINPSELGFAYSETKDTGRKPYSPSDMLKLYLYGYFNGIRSSRKLERECSRNVELMWLIGCLKTKRPGSKAEPEYGSKAICVNCPARDKCTTNKDGKYIRRGEFQASADNAFLRVYQNRDLYKTRKSVDEHVFGTVKARFGFRYLTVRRTGMVKTDTCLFFLAYNLKRAVNILGTLGLIGV